VAVTIKSQVNPLEFIEVEFATGDAHPSEEQILKFLCEPDTPRAVGDFVGRYRQISQDAPKLFAAPAEARLLERLVWPLRHAKGSFMLGNYLGTISLCGMVGEMAAILVFDLSRAQLNERPMDVPAQKALFGSSFERLGQERRIEVLQAYGMTDEATAAHLTTIRTKRRRYLHLWSEDHARLEADAVACFRAAVSVVISALGIRVGEHGHLVLKQGILEYLEQHGVTPKPVETK
jgi:hypothetical protein